MICPKDYASGAPPTGSPRGQPCSPHQPWPPRVLQTAWERRQRRRLRAVGYTAGGAEVVARSLRPPGVPFQGRDPRAAAGRSRGPTGPQGRRPGVRRVMRGHRQARRRPAGATRWTFQDRRHLSLSLRRSIATDAVFEFMVRCLEEQISSPVSSRRGSEQRVTGSRCPGHWPWAPPGHTSTSKFPQVYRRELEPIAVQGRPEVRHNAPELSVKTLGVHPAEPSGPDLSPAL